MEVRGGLWKTKWKKVTEAEEQDGTKHPEPNRALVEEVDRGQRPA